MSAIPETDYRRESSWAEPSPTGSAAGDRITATGLRLAYGDSVVVDGLDLRIPAGSITSVIGPNGCGKSTTLRALGRLLRPKAGSIVLDGEDISKLATRDIARRLGMLPQSPHAPEGLTVVDLVTRGRHPHQRWYRQWSADDEEVVAEALEWTDIGDLADRDVDSLSGGQRQRVWLSMVLAQGTELLLLDEPTTFLDMAHQIDVLDLVARLHRERSRTVVMVLHDLTLAARYSERLVAMRDGVVLAVGTPWEVLTPELLAEVFGLTAMVVEDPVTGTPLVVPIGRCAAG